MSHGPRGPVSLRDAVPDDAPRLARIWSTGWHDGHDGHAASDSGAGDA